MFLRVLSLKCNTYLCGLQMHDTYVKVCKKLGVSPTDQSEFVSLLSFITLIEVTKAKDTRMSMVGLRFFQDKMQGMNKYGTCCTSNVTFLLSYPIF